MEYRNKVLFITVGSNTFTVKDVHSINTLPNGIGLEYVLLDNRK